MNEWKEGSAADTTTVFAVSGSMKVKNERVCKKTMHGLFSFTVRK